MKYLFFIPLLCLSLKNFAQQTKTSKYRKGHSSSQPWSAKPKRSPFASLGSGIITIGAGGVLIGGGIYSYNINDRGETKGANQMRTLAAAGGILCLAGTVITVIAATKIAKYDAITGGLRLKGNGLAFVF